MALSANWHMAAADSGALDRQRRRRAFQAARRHSRLVRRLRVALPASGLIAIAGFVVMTRIGLPDNLDLTAARLSVTPSAIIMDRPHMTGFDKEDRKFSVSADRAVQALMNPDLVRLEKITASIAKEGEPGTTITADAGDYDQANSTLKLFGAIAVDSPEGYAVRMTDADIDFGAGTLASPNPARVTYEGNETTGQSVSITGGGKVIVFTGGVRTTILPNGDPSGSAAPTTGQAQVTR
jgi:lipopolysaccharide export system protein LptC